MLHVSMPKRSHLLIRLISDEALLFRNLKSDGVCVCVCVCVCVWVGELVSINHSESHISICDTQS
jgi:hypothetical protein